MPNFADRKRSGSWDRVRIRQFLEQRYSPRLHMSAILATSGLVAMLSSWILLNLGVGSMLVRYPIGIALAYATFLVGVFVWLRAMGLRDSSGHQTSSLDGGDLLDVARGGGSSSGSSGGGISLPRGGGGTFDGGGASSAWEGGPRAVGLNPGQLGATRSASSSGKGFSFDFGDALDGDAIVLLILATGLVLVVAASSGYLIWIAPDVLTEAAFGAMLAGGLARRTKDETATGWIAGVIRKTWWPFAIVLAIAWAFAAFAHFPQAQTFSQAVALALR